MTAPPTVDGDPTAGGTEVDVDGAAEQTAAMPTEQDPVGAQEPDAAPEPEPEPERETGPEPSEVVDGESVDPTYERDESEHEELVEEPVAESAEAPPTADDVEGTVVTEPPAKPKPDPLSRKRSRSRSRNRSVSREPEPEPEPAEVVAVQDEESVELPATDEPDDAEGQEPVEESAEAPATADDVEGTAVTEPPGKPKPDPLSRKPTRNRSRNRSASVSRDPEPEPEPAEVVAVDDDESVELPANDEPVDPEGQERLEERVEEPVEEPVEERVDSRFAQVARPSGLPVSTGTGGEVPYPGWEPTRDSEARPAVRTRRSVLILAGLVLVLIVTAFVATRLLAGGEDPEPDDAAPPASTAPNGVPSQSAPAEVPGDGTHNVIRVLPTGDLEVRQLIQSTTPLSGLSLAVPTDRFLDEGPSVSDLHVVADGVAVDVPPALGSTPVSFSVAGAQTIDLTYRLSGVLVRSTSRPDRAMARAIWLDTSYEPSGGPATVSFQGATVVNLVCTDGSAREAPVTCGRRTESGDWEVRAQEPLDESRVMALIELPPSTSG